MISQALRAGVIFSPPLSRLCTKPLPAKHPVTIQDGGIEAIYLAFRIPLRNNACTAGYNKT